MKDTVRGYVAGLIDGEGCITIETRKFITKDGEETIYYYGSVKIGMKSPLTIHKLHKLLKTGNVYTQKSGMVYLVIHGDKATPILEEIVDLMITKREQAELYLLFMKTKRANAKSFYDQMKLLKKDSLTA